MNGMGKLLMVRVVMFMSIACDVSRVEHHVQFN